MSRAIGIDLGTTTCEISYIKDGKPVVIKNEKYGNGIAIPSVISVKKDEIIVGKVAKRQLINKASSTISEFKRYMGTDKKIELHDKKTNFRKVYTPEELSAIMLKTLKLIAEEELGDISEAVITVPANYNNAQRKATKEAARLAGLNVKRIINEPTAAAFAYGADNLGLTGNILVYDLGGGTFDCSVLNIKFGIVEVISSRGHNRLGGKDFDEKIENHIKEYIKRNTSIDVENLNLRQKNQIKEEAERAKKDLSVEKCTEIMVNNFAIDSDGDSIDIELELSREQFADISSDLMRRSEAIMDTALKAAKITADQIDYVLAIGGSSRMPMVHDLLRRKFGDKIQRGVDPDEAVARGAAVQAGINSGELNNEDDIFVTDRCSYSLGTSVKGNLFSAIIERDSIIPISKSETYVTITDNQERMLIDVFQGDNELVADNEFIGEFVVNELPQLPAGEAKVEVTFEYDLDGMLGVSAKVLGTGKVVKETMKLI